jgi:hypothetical protein
MKIEKRVTEVRWMTGAELSKFLDLSPSRVSRLTSEGIFEKREKDGHYDSELALHCYGRFILAPNLFSDRRY